MNIDQIIMQAVKSPFGIFVLTLIALGVGLLILTFLPELIAIIIIAVIIIVALVYFGVKL